MQSNEETARKPGRRFRYEAYPFLFRVLHWVLPLCLVVMVLTGASLHAAARPSWSLFGGRLPSGFWPGQANLVHQCGAIVFVASIAAVAWLYSRSPGRRRATHYLLLGGGAAIFGSALVLLNPAGPSWLYWAARGVHSVLGLIVLPVALVWHAVLGLTRFRRLLGAAFNPLARPSWRQAAWFVPLAIAAAMVVLAGSPEAAPWRVLAARRVSPAYAELSDPAKLPWDTAQPLRIELANGTGFDRGRTRVTLRALHDGRELYVLAEWNDPVEDRQYMPWEKTAAGWRRRATDPKDEQVYYEDKFALIFPTVPDRLFERFGCTTYCHLGGGRAYGYKGCEGVVDVWHWKATRTDPVGQVDDKYWSTIDFSKDDVGRYGDPKQGGGYKKNEAGPHPAFLPAGPEAIVGGIIRQQQAVPYSEAQAAAMPQGSIVPGIVASAFEGDRGDVRCRSEHADRRWRLWIRRKLDTGSSYDRMFVPGQAYSFGCAAFDRASKRHAYNFNVYRLLIEP